MTFVRDPDVDSLFAAVHSVAGYQIPADSRAMFKAAHAWITGRPETRGLARLRDPASPASSWRNKRTNGILDDVQNTVGALHYHLGNIVTMEQGVLDAVAAHPSVIERLTATGSLIGGGSTQRLDYEYQALVFAIRRCLDYLALSVAAYFKHSLHEPFKALEPLLVRLSAKSPVAAALAVVLNETRWCYERFVVAPSGAHTTRNRIAHYKAVSAGCLNVAAWGVALAGDETKPFDPDRRRLGAQLAIHVRDAETLVRAVLTTMADADRAAG